MFSVHEMTFVETIEREFDGRKYQQHAIFDTESFEKYTLGTTRTAEIAEGLKKGDKVSVILQIANTKRGTGIYIKSIQKAK